MKKNPPSKSGFFNPRVFLGFVLCSAGAVLAMFSFAAPTASRTTAKETATFKPVVIDSFSHGISPRIRDLPLVTHTTKPTTYEVHQVRPIRPPLAPLTLPVVDPVHQKTALAGPMPTPIQTFEGINQAGGCGNCIPPDNNGAVGPNHYVEMVNSSYAVYSKTGTVLAGPVDINGLWANLPGECRNQNDGDPVVVYDHFADRWVLSQFSVSGQTYDECVAVSKTPDPTGAFYVYDFVLSSTVFHDYPKLGVWPDAYYMTTNEFPPNATLSEGVGAFALERDKMLLGQPARLVFFDLGTVNTMFAGALPSDADGAPPPLGSPNYFVEVDSKAFVPPNDAMRIWKFHVDWSNPANSTFGNNGQPNSVINVADFTPAICLFNAGTCVPQFESPYQLDALGDRIMFRLAYRNFGDHEAFVAQHTVVADARTGIRWYEVRSPGNSPTIFQTGTFAPVDTLYRWMGSMAMDRMGNIAVGYSTSSAATFPSIAYAGRLVADPLGQLAQSETQMFAGTGAENVAFYVPPSGRWGDYTDLTIDPTDDCTFWYVNEYFGAEGTTDPGAPWRTRIGSFKFANCVAPAVLQSVVSRKTHGTAGTFEINLPLSGTRGLECRTGGANGAHDVVFKFGAPVTFTATATCGGNAATTSTAGSEVTVHCTGVPNAQTIPVALNTTAGNFLVQMGVLLADVNQSTRTDAGDVTLVRQQTPSTPASLPTWDFRRDVNADGRIDAGDVTLARQRTPSVLPP
jgi:hypothetical protein